MRKLLGTTVVAVYLATGSLTFGQTVDIQSLLDQLLGGGGTGLPGGLGQSPSTGPGTTGLVPGTPTQTGGGADSSGGGGASVLDLPTPQESLRSFRSRRPGLMVNAGIARYRERTANLGRVGPSAVELPDVDEEPKVLPIIVSDILGGFFDLFNQIISGVNLLTSIQLGTLGSGTSGGFDLNQLLQQFLNSQSARSVASATPEPALRSFAESSPSLVIPLVPVDQTPGGD